MANKKYKLTDGNYWATDGIHDFGQNKTQREINAALVQADSDLSGAIKFFLQSTGDTTDRSTEIRTMLLNYGVCYLAEGDFYIKAGVHMPDNTSIFGMGAGTKVHLSDDNDAYFCFNVGSYCTIENLTIIGSSTQLPYASYTKGNRRAIQLIGDYTNFNQGSYSHNFAKLSNLTITDFNGSGIWAFKNDGSASFLATNIDILRCHTGINIELFSEFHSFSNVRCRWCNIALVMQGGNNLFSNCHFDVNLMLLKIDNINNTLVNESHSSFSNCTFCHPDNNTGYAAYLLGSINGLLFSTCQFWYGKVYIESCKDITFDNNIFGGTNNDITITGTDNSHPSESIMFVNNRFRTHTPTLTIVHARAIRTIWENNVNDDGTISYYNLSRGFTGTIRGQIVRAADSFTGIQLENISYVREAGYYETSIPLPWYIVPTPTINVTRVVIYGIGNVDPADCTFTPVNGFLRIKAPVSGATVGQMAIANVVMDITALGT